MSGATALSSSSVGSRFSANWCSVKPPTTRTHCGGGVIATWRFSMAMASASAAHAVPAQLHVEVEPAADDVQVVVDQAGQHATALQVDDPCRGAGERHHVFVAPDRGEDAVRDRDGAGRRVRAIERGEAAVPKNQVSTHVRTSCLYAQFLVLLGALISWRS